MAELKLPADINIFGDHIRAPVADVRQRLAPEGGDHPGDGKDPAIDPLRPLDKPNDRRELTHLNAADQRGSGADPRIAGDRPDVRIVDQRRDQPGRGIPVQQGVAIDADQQIAAGGGGACFERYRFSLIGGKVDHPQPRLLLRQLLEHLGGVVRRAVVNGDHFEIGVTLGQRRADGFPSVFLLVKTRDQDRNQRIARQRRRRGILPPRPVAFQLKPEIKAPGDPQH